MKRPCWIFLLLGATLLDGCAGSLTPTLTVSSRELHRTAFMRSEMRGQAVGVFPVHPDPEQHKAARAVQSALLKALRERFPQARWIAAQELEARALAAGAAQEWNALRRPLWGAKALDRETLDRFATASAVRYLLFPHLLVEQTESSVRLTLVLSLWDPRSGTLLWQGEGQGKGQHTVQSLWGPVHLPVSMGKLAQKVADTLVARMP